MYIAIDESKKPLVENQSVKNFDFIVSSFNGKYLVDIKGKSFSSKSKNNMWDNWISIDDLSGLRIWGNHFNAFIPLLVIPYNLQNDTDKEYLLGKADFIEHKGKQYAFTAITLADYYTNAKPRAKKWKAIYVHRDKFEELSKPLSNFIPEIKKKSGVYLDNKNLLKCFLAKVICCWFFSIHIKYLHNVLQATAIIPYLKNRSRTISFSFEKIIKI